MDVRDKTGKLSDDLDAITFQSNNYQVTIVHIDCSEGFEQVLA